MQAIGLSTDKTTAVMAPNTIYLVKLSSFTNLKYEI